MVRTPRHSRLVIAVAALVAAAVGLGACGGGDDGGEDTAPTVVVSLPEDAATVITAAPGSEPTGASSPTTIAADTTDPAETIDTAEPGDPDETDPRDTTTTVEPPDVQSVEEVLRVAVDDHLLPAHAELVAAAGALAAAADASCADVAALQGLFREARLAWDRVRAYRFGPQVQMRLEAAVDWWPVDVEKVEEAAAGDAPMTPEELDALGSPVRGLRVVEHLLWSETPLGARRCSYVARAAESVALRTEAVATEFAAGADAFVAGGADSLGVLLAGTADAVYRTCDNELGMPAGANFGLVGPDVSLVRQGGAVMATDDIRALVDEVEAVYVASIRPLLEERYPDQPDVLLPLFEQVDVSFDLIPANLVQAIEEKLPFVVGATNACREVRRNLITTTASLLGIVLVLPVGDGD